MMDGFLAGAMGYPVSQDYVDGYQSAQKKWVLAFNAYQKALAEPYFDQDDESRQSNRQEVERCFDRLKQLAEEV